VRRRRVTINDVADVAGVSRQTVSRVINDRDYVAGETRARVQAAIDQLGYQPHAIARSLATGRTRTLGCISPNLVDYTFACMIEGAQAEARRHGYLILTGSAPTEGDVEPLLEEMLRRQVDGLLVLNPCMDGRRGLFPPLVRRGVALACLKDTLEGDPISSVSCDDRQGGYQATQHLIDLDHRVIATILGPENEQCTLDRLAGYRRALSGAGIAFDPALVTRGDWSATSGYRATRQLLAGARQPSAIFAQNDRMAVGAIRALRDAHLLVPDDVSVIGFDDIPLASYFDPPLTTLRQPMEECGRRAVRLLLETIKDPDRAPEQVLTPSRLVERGSCGPPRC
jgi:DNA-binding LacI/PurR family transcriptional regulator